MKSGLGSRSRSRLEKKSGAEAAKKLAGSPGLLEDNKHKEIVLLLVFFRYNSTRKLYGKKKQLFYLFYIICSSTLLFCGERNILPNLTNSQEPEPVFLPLEPKPEPLEKRIPGAGAATKLAGSPALNEITI